MDEEMIRRLLNREYPDSGRNVRTRNDNFRDRDLAQQSHVHEFLGSTWFAENNNNRHNHRFSGVTSEVVPTGGGEHRHTILTNTDSVGHHHEVGIETGPPIDVGNGKHVHFVEGQTTLDDFHVHGFEFTTLIENPTIPNRCECNCKCTCERERERR